MASNNISRGLAIEETMDLADSSIFPLTVCICTRNRPEDLRKALQSIRHSTIAVHQVVVSDDSTDGRSREMVEREFPEVLFIEGPRRGLCANRNVAVASASGSYVLFIDDDAILGIEFVAHVQSELQALSSESRSRIIVSGIERQGQELIYPNDQNLLGFQRQAYKPGARLNTVVINATVFPRALFRRMAFDSNLIYGYDEVDLTTRAVADGFRILLCPNAVNDHFPSPVNRDLYAAHIAASRLYVTFKRYAFTERNVRKSLLFAFIAPAHLLAGLVKRNGLAGILQSIDSLAESVRYLMRHLRHRADAGIPVFRVSEDAFDAAGR